MKKSIVVILGICLILLLCACGSSGQKQLNETDIKNDINDKIKVFEDNTELNMSCSSFTINRRKIEESSDQIWCEVEMSDSSYSMTANCYLKYNHYDVGGWIMDEFSYLDSPKITSTLSKYNEAEQIVRAKFDNYEFLRDDYANENNAFAFLIHEKEEYYTYNGLITISYAIETSIRDSTVNIWWDLFQSPVNSVYYDLDIEGSWYAGSQYDYEIFLDIKSVVQDTAYVEAVVYFDRAQYGEETKHEWQGNTTIYYEEYGGEKHIRLSILIQDDGSTVSTLLIGEDGAYYLRDGRRKAEFTREN